MTKTNLSPPAPSGNAYPPARAPKVEWALWCACQGFRVIPIKAGAKFPPTVRDAFSGATSDAAEILRLWRRPGHEHDNPAVYLPEHVAIDLDMHDENGGATEWRASAQRLGITKDDLQSALVIKTRKGRHAIWRRPVGADIWSANRIEPNVDLRALGAQGYLIAPGAEVEFRGADGSCQRHLYEIERCPDELGELPAHLVEAILVRSSAPKPRCAVGAIALGAEPDGSDAWTNARAIASGWEPAVEGDGGHAVLTALVMRIGDAGLTAGACVDLLTEPGGWNERSAPPWEVDELDYQVRSLYASRVQPVGCAQTSAEFRGVEIDPPAPVQDRALDGLVTRNFAEIELRAIEWLWPGLLPKGYITIIAGESGAGKSTALADVVARITTGAPWPGESASSARPPAPVLWLGAEDSAAEMTGPRLRACGADLSKVVEIIGCRRDDRTDTFSMQDDLERVRWLLEDASAAGKPFAALVIDPVTSYLPGQKLRKVDLSDAGQLRSILEPWLRLAEEFSIAVVCVTHFGKDTSRAMMHRVLGSSAFAQTCRSLLAVIPQPPGIDGEVDPFAKALLQVKTNLPEHPGGAWLFKTERVEVGTDRRNGKAILATRPVWGELDAKLTPESAAARSQGGQASSRTEDNFRAWLSTYFSAREPGEWVTAGEVSTAAREDGVASARWWAGNSSRFLDKRNDNGTWVCRPKSGAAPSGDPITQPEF